MLKISISERKKHLLILTTALIITMLSIMIWFSISCYNAGLSTIKPSSIKIIKIKKIPFYFKENKLKNIEKHKDYKYDIYFKYNGTFSYIEYPSVENYKDPSGNLFISMSARNSLNIFRNLKLHDKTYKVTLGAYPYSKNMGKSIIMYYPDEIGNKKISTLKSNRILINAKDNK